MIFRRRRRGDRPTSDERPAQAGAGQVPSPDQGPPQAEETPAAGPEPSPAQPAGSADTQGSAEAPPSAPSEGEGAAGSDLRGPFASTRAALAPVKKRHVLVASMGLVGIVAGGILVFSAISFWWTSQPSFCNRCHVMNKYVAAWQSSVHQDVNCEACHLTPGFFGFLGGKISGLQVVMNYIRGTYEDYSFNAAVTNAACLQCHDDILDGNIHDKASGITVSHRDIIDMGGKCMNCHSTVAHGSEVSFGSATHPTMETCLKCHNDNIAPLDCDLCHTGREGPSEQAHVSPAPAT